MKTRMPQTSNRCQVKFYRSSPHTISCQKGDHICDKSTLSKERPLSTLNADLMATPLNLDKQKDTSLDTREETWVQLVDIFEILRAIKQTNYRRSCSISLVILPHRLEYIARQRKRHVNIRKLSHEKLGHEELVHSCSRNITQAPGSITNKLELKKKTGKETGCIGSDNQHTADS